MSELILQRLKIKNPPAKLVKHGVRVPLQKKSPSKSTSSRPEPSSSLPEPSSSLPKPDSVKVPIIFQKDKQLPIADRKQFLEKIKKTGTILSALQTIPGLAGKSSSSSSDSSVPPPLEPITPPKKRRSPQTKKSVSHDRPKTQLKTRKVETQLDDRIPKKLPTEKKIKEITQISVQEKPSTLLEIKKIAERLPKKVAKVIFRFSQYYLNNRELFVSSINELFRPYKRELLAAADSYSCSNPQLKEFNLLVHQKLVRDYINVYTPYRGLLLYHGLGSGKTCSSIAIAEGLKSKKQIIVMTPKSLQPNFLSELKKCGDELYRRNQYWEAINIIQQPELIKPLSQALSLNISYIEGAGVVWLVNVKQKTPNYDQLSANQQKSLDKQLTEMIDNKYLFIAYNGIRRDIYNKLIEQYSEDGKNLFSNKVVIIDEAHNFVSKISNKIKSSKKSLSTDLYEALLRAQNVRLVFLTGTPIINYPNEIGIMLNMLRGYIKTWKFTLTINNIEVEEQEEPASDVKKPIKINTPYFLDLFKSKAVAGELLDYIHYSSNTLTITRNPFGFYTYYKDDKYRGVRLGEDGNVDDETFIKVITDILQEDEKFIVEHLEKKKNVCLPAQLTDFSSWFIEDNMVHNMNLFKKRILGLVSYFPDIEKLLPNYSKEKDFHLVKLEMSPHQFHIYNIARTQERKLEEYNKRKKVKQGGKDNIYEDTVSTYRIFSRAFCNFVFPDTIVRPLPGERSNIEEVIDIGADEDLLDALSTKDVEEEGIDLQDARIAAEQSQTQSKFVEPSPSLSKDESKQEGVSKKKKKLIIQGEELESYGKLEKGEEEEITEKVILKSYDQKIKYALQQLEKKEEEYLVFDKLKEYSPKFHKILENLDIQGGEKHRGLHLIYSQFRTLEGIGIFTIVLRANGYAQFKIRKEKGEFILDISPEDLSKPKYVLYTGKEDDDEKEIVRNIFNGTWEYIPIKLRKELQQKFGVDNNNFGQIIKVIMITASGAEGISLKNVRFVHILEPYWHPVRIEQVIGRARRICSHQELPPSLQTVEVFLYLMIFSKEQLEDDRYKEIRNKDLSKQKYTQFSYEELQGNIELGVDIERDELEGKDEGKPANITASKTKFGKTGLNLKEELRLIPFTSDETLYEISTIKERINKDILKNVKEASIDCSIHNVIGGKEKLKCFSFTDPTSSRYSYPPNISSDDKDDTAANNKVEKKVPTVLYEIGEGDKKESYAIDKYAHPEDKSRKVYDLKLQEKGILEQVGILKKNKSEEGYKLVIF